MERDLLFVDLLLFRTVLLSNKASIILGMFVDLLLLSNKASIILGICGKKKVGRHATITATITSPSLILANRLTRRVACVGGGVM